MEGWEGWYLEFSLGVRVVGEWGRGHLFRCWGWWFCGGREFADQIAHFLVTVFLDFVLGNGFVNWKTWRKGAKSLR
jgi:hypothetical protein